MKALLLALFLLVGVFGGPPATLKVSPKNQFASTKESITFYITIKPHLDNGAFCFGFEGEDTRTSCQELDNKSPPTFREILKLKGVGAYRICIII